MHMDSQWHRAQIEDYICPDLEKLVAIITLLQGASIEEIFSLLDSIPTFKNMLNPIMRLKIPSLLGAVLPSNGLSGVRGLEPDLVGDLFILRSDLPNSAIVGAFSLDRFAVGSRLWRLLADFHSDARIESTIVGWIQAVVADLKGDTMALEVFLNERPSSLSDAIAPVVADALSRITAGLRLGDETCESLLLRADQKNRSVPEALVREAQVLTGMGRYAEALTKLESAEAISQQESLDAEDLIWLSILSLRAACLKETGDNEQRVSAIDGVIDFCSRRITAGAFSEGAYSDEKIREFIDALLCGSGVLTPRGLVIF